ncbi:hypothetical protein BD779DRAFT_1554109 [Infundibulicybe gibba]|nr:hypothetical protein BD779DRAFT_1554109 [Infundibulicybe gibba]
MPVPTCPRIGLYWCLRGALSALVCGFTLYTADLAPLETTSDGDDDRAFDLLHIMDDGFPCVGGERRDARMHIRPHCIYPELHTTRSCKHGDPSGEVDPCCVASPFRKRAPSAYLPTLRHPRLVLLYTCSPPTHLHPLANERGRTNDSCGRAHDG